MAFGSKNKGSSFERAIAEWFSDQGFAARRVPLSGAAKGYPGDVSVDFRGRELLVEAKAVEAAYHGLHRAADEGGLCIVYQPGSAYLAASEQNMRAILTGDFPLPINWPVLKLSLSTLNKAMRGANLFVSKLNRKPWVFALPLDETNLILEPNQLEGIKLSWKKVIG